MNDKIQKKIRQQLETDKVPALSDSGLEEFSKIKGRLDLKRR
jgi:hypothetical protein